MFISTGLALGLYLNIHNDQRRWIALTTPPVQEIPAVFSPEFTGRTLFADFSPKMTDDKIEKKGKN